MSAKEFADTSKAEKREFVANFHVIRKYEKAEKLS
jgi:hypothetical protein